MHILGESAIDGAIYNYIRWGLPPGSFTTAMLMLDRDGMEMKAHPLLKMGTSGNLLDKFHVSVSRYFPKELIGENFISWKGYDNMHPRDKRNFLSSLNRSIVKCRLSGKVHPLIEVYDDLEKR